MTNDKDGAALLPCPFCEAELSRQNDKDGYFWMHPGFITDESCFLSGQGVFPRKADLWNRRAALQSHGQAFDAAGVREAFDAGFGAACAAVYVRTGETPPELCDAEFDKAWDIHVSNSLPIPEAPASVEPVAKVPAFATEEMVEAGLKTGSRYGATAMRNIWREMYMAAQSAHPEPDNIGSHFGNGGGLDPVETDETFRFAQGIVALANSLQGRPAFDSEIVSVKLIRAVAMVVNGEAFRRMGLPPSPGFGGGDLREALGRLSKFCDEWAKMRQRDDDIHGLHFGEDRQAVLRASDIRTVVAALSHDQRGGSGE